MATQKTKASQEELVSYFQDVLSTINVISLNLEKRNKTLRLKAIANLLVITKARVSASLSYARAGGYEEYILRAQQDLYNPILEYLADEVVK